ncbi:hypothetical protein HAX54_011855 [Datura stramonium]|uniref:Uncharacterized protein n=1 Tax=Datura stramonium TaxID=4076 RepID=A0ABS8RXW4_DATST|nr:hypothetical protein [Datura stramonium]
MCGSAITAITQDYYKKKEGSQEKERDLKLNSEKLGDDYIFVDMSESDIALITQVVVSAATINVNVAVNEEAIVDGGVPRQDVAHPATYVAIEVDDTLVVEIGDDDKTPAVYRRNRNRCPGKAQQSPFVAGFGLSDFGSVSVKRVKGRSPLMPSITVPVDYGLIQAFSSFVDEGMITKMGSVAVYSNDDDYLESSYDFEVSSVSKKTCDCGIFTSCFAEYFIKNIEIPVENFDVDAIRSRYDIIVALWEKEAVRW